MEQSLPFLSLPNSKLKFHEKNQLRSVLYLCCRDWQFLLESIVQAFSRKPNCAAVCRSCSYKLARRIDNTPLAINQLCQGKAHSAFGLYRRPSAAYARHTGKPRCRGKQRNGPYDCLLLHIAFQWVFIRQLAFSASTDSWLEVQHYGSRLNLHRASAWPEKCRSIFVTLQKILNRFLVSVGPIILL